MPTSRPGFLDYLANTVMALRPGSILDIGPGFGTKGMIFREYTKWWGRPDCKVDCIEIFPEYIQDLQRLIYDNVYLGDATEVIKSLGRYDFIYCGDMIEHLTREKGLKFLEDLKAHSSNIIIVTPIKLKAQGAAFGNEHERHISQWTDADFPGWERLAVGNQALFKYTGK